MTKLLTLILISLPLFAFTKNDDFTISGRILNLKSEGLPFVNVLLIESKDSSLVKGTTTNESGKFEFEDIEAGNYKIMVSFVGYKKYYSDSFQLDETNKAIVLDDIILEENTEVLDEYAVVAQKPFIERRLDKIIVNVENSIVAAGNTALEVLKRSPGVIVDKDGNISLKGKSGVLIMIDGKQTYLSGPDLSNMLKTMSADQIEKIEIMTNPSAKYDAAGNAGIINIVMKKNQMLGVNGRVNAGYSQWNYARFNAGFNMNYRTEKWNFFGSYNRNDSKGQSEFGVDRIFRENGSIINYFDQRQKQINNNQTNSGKFAIDFYPNKKHTFGVFVNGMSETGSENGNNTSLVKNSNSDIESGSSTSSKTTEMWNNITGNFNYKWNIDTLGKELSVNFDYARFNSKDKQLYQTDYFDSAYNYFAIPYILRSELPSTVQVMSGKADYVHPIGEKIKLEAGIKSSHVYTDNNAQFWQVENNVDIVDSGKTNHFLYTENINAAYFNYMMELGDKFSFQLGLRTENTFSKGEQLTTDSTFTRNYTNLFPSGFITWEASKKHELSLSYSRRIDRPDYEDLNPFIYFLDPYSYQKGNTLLLPQYSDSYEFSHTFMGFLTTSFNYTHTTGVMTEVTQQIDSTFTTFVTKQNLNTQDTYSVSSMLPLPIGKWWMSMNFITVYNARFRGDLQGGTFDKSATAFMLNSQNTFTFKKGWSGEISAFYMSKQVYGIFLMYPMSNITLGIQKKFAKDRGSVKVTVSDIFWNNRFRGAVQYQNMDIKIDTRYMSRVVGLQLSWKFGNSKAQSQRKESGASDELDRIKGGG